MHSLKVSTGFGLAEADRGALSDPDADVFGNQFVFTFTRSDVALNGGDVSIVLEYGSTLTGWTPVTVPTGDTIVSGVTFDATDGTPNDSIIATIPTGGAAQLFVRLKAVI